MRWRIEGRVRFLKKVFLCAQIIRVMRKKGLKKHFKVGLFLKTALLFVAAQAVGLYTVWRIAGTEVARKIEKQAQAYGGQDNWWVFLVYFAVVTSLILISIKFLKKSRILFKAIFALVLFGGIDVVARLFFGEPWAMFLTFALVALRFAFPNVILHNLVIVLAVGGVGGIFGMQFSPKATLIILGILAAYDIIAVYYTKHMVKMAKAMAQKGALFAVVIPKQVKKGTLKIPERLKPGGKFMILGGGDLALPLFLAASVAQDNLWGGVMVSAFALLGLLGMHIAFSLQKKPRAMPALPPICLGAVVGYFVAFLL